jgi:outer membrane protein TolC
LKLQVTQDVSLAFINVQKAIEAIDTAKSALRQAEENMDLAEGRYRTGEGDAIEYSDAELNLTQSRNDVVQTRYDYLQSLADLAYALGMEK